MSVTSQAWLWVWSVFQESPPAAYILCFQEAFKTSVSLRCCCKLFLFLYLVLSRSGLADLSNTNCPFATGLIFSLLGQRLWLTKRPGNRWQPHSVRPASAQLRLITAWGVGESEAMLQDLVLGGFLSVCPVLHPENIPSVSRQSYSRGNSRAISPPWHKNLLPPAALAKTRQRVCVAQSLLFYKACSTHTVTCEKAPYTSASLYECLNRYSLWYFDRI